MIGRYRGNEVDTAGDGFFATFDGPARAVRCAQAIVQALQPIGLDIRAGVHTGEVEVIDHKVGGIAVNIGARVAGRAQPAEVLVSQTVRDLTAGSELVFEDAGEHELKVCPTPDTSTGWRASRERQLVAEMVLTRGVGRSRRRPLRSGSDARPRSRCVRDTTYGWSDVG